MWRSFARWHDGSRRRNRATRVELGRRLSRRVADRVYIEDQGRVAIVIGDRVVPGSEIRRKVLALPCFLLTRPDMSATRDQVLDAIWPELEPDVAINSLNQTLYFLRRVFEPDYKEDLSPGYVHHDSEVIWLDTGLVRSRSADARAFLRDAERPGYARRGAIDSTNLYRGRFALDFEYEDWSAGVPGLRSRGVSSRWPSGPFSTTSLLATTTAAIRVRSSGIGRRPAAENIEVSLLRLYRVHRCTCGRRRAVRALRGGHARRARFGASAPRYSVAIGKVPY